MNQRELVHLRGRIFGQPLLINDDYLHGAVFPILGERLGISIDASVPKPEAVITDKKRKTYRVTENDIAIIPIIGPTVKRSTGDAMSGGPTTYGEIENKFLDAVTDPAIRGIVLEIDSPGGEASGVIELAELIRSQRGSKPIYAVADSDAYSAAYWIASAAEKVYISKSGGIGSIGVVAMHVDKTERNAKEGLKYTAFYAGKHKIDYSPNFPLKEEAAERIQDHVNILYNQFCSSVADNRKLSVSAIKKTEADIFFSDSAVDVGLADKVGNLSTAISDMIEAINFGKSNGAKMNAELEVVQPAVSEPQVEVAADLQEVDQTVTEQSLPTQPQSLEAVVEEASNDGYDAAIEIVDLCFAANNKDLALELLRKRVSIEDARKELAIKAADLAKSDEPIISAANTETIANINANENGLIKAAELIAQKMNTGR